jgi:hypothetical protein
VNELSCLEQASEYGHDVWDSKSLEVVTEYLLNATVHKPVVALVINEAFQKFRAEILVLEFFENGSLLLSIDLSDLLGVL